MDYSLVIVTVLLLAAQAWSAHCQQKTFREAVQSLQAAHQAVLERLLVSARAQSSTEAVSALAGLDQAKANLNQNESLFEADLETYKKETRKKKRRSEPANDGGARSPSSFVAADGEEYEFMSDVDPVVMQHFPPETLKY